jgi:Outer membrane lipoprotein-sorting protein
MTLGQHKHFTIQHLVIIMMLTASSSHAQEHPDENIDEALGLEIMHEVYKRHQQFAFIYEEQSMVMIDKNGDRDTRKVKRYSRVEADGSVKFLLLFDSPDEISGVALLANRDALGKTNKYIYLPAFGEQLIENVSSGKDGKFLGTDFSIENLAGEVLDDYIYVRRPDIKINNIECFVIDVYQREEDLVIDILPADAQANRRHFISKNNYYITRTDYFDNQGRVFTKQSHHDVNPVDGQMWRSNMILMEDIKEGHQSLIKINRRVYSRDYVSPEIFTADWLFKNYPFISPAETEDGDEEFISENEDDDTVVLDIHNNLGTDIEMRAVQ